MKKTYIKTIHEEYFNKKSLSIIINYYNNINDIIDSYILYYYNNMYVVFKSISDAIDFILYGTDTICRAYIDEDEFDLLYDNGVDGYFKNKIVWINNN